MRMTKNQKMFTPAMLTNPTAWAQWWWQKGVLVPFTNITEGHGVAVLPGGLLSPTWNASPPTGAGKASIPPAQGDTLLLRAGGLPSHLTAPSLPLMPHVVPSLPFTPVAIDTGCKPPGLRFSWWIFLASLGPSRNCFNRWRNTYRRPKRKEKRKKLSSHNLISFVMQHVTVFPSAKKVWGKND